MKLVKMLLITMILWAGSLLPVEAASAKVMWNGAELVKGQLGLLTIKKPINLWEQKNNKLTYVRILKPGERYRVYGFNTLQNQFKVGGTFVITNIEDRVEYKTPSKEKLRMAAGDFILENAELVNKIIQTKPELQNHPEVNKIRSRISRLPLALLEKLRQNHVTILLVDEPITNFPEFAYLKGEIPKGWENSGKTWEDVPGAGGEERVIIRVGYSDYGRGHGSLNLELHETAHTIDHVLFKNISSTSEFQKIWKEEAENLFGSHNYYKNFPEEYFAETFTMFYFDSESRQKLKMFAPLTYTLFQNLN